MDPQEKDLLPKGLGKRGVDFPNGDRSFFTSAHAVPPQRLKPLVPPKPKALSSKPAVVQVASLIDYVPDSTSAHDQHESRLIELKDNTILPQHPESDSPPPLPQRPSKDIQTSVVRPNNLLSGTTKAFQSIYTDATATVKNATVGATKAVQAIPATIKSTVPTTYLDDFKDHQSLRQGNPGLCSYCIKIPLDQCFVNANDAKAPYLCWSSSLSRIALHGSWCKFCKLLLHMLCREQHDPVMTADVQAHLDHDWLRGVPFQTWLDDEYIHDKNLWPFGRSERAQDSALFDTVSEMGERIGNGTLRVASHYFHSRLAGKPYKRPNARQSKRYSEKPTYPVSAVIMVTISTAKAERPGLLWIDLMGRNSSPASQEVVLSHFKLRAVDRGLSVTRRPQGPLSYAHVLDPAWIELSMAKLWLSDCELNHGHSCGEHGWAAAMEAPTAMRLIDVIDLCIISHNPSLSSRFVALSYVWGGANSLKLTSSNIREFSRPGALRVRLSKIPRTILDAMEVVRSLGERYLWCDALCIVQETSAESQYQINNMDRVYGSALFTIVAASGHDAQAGLPGVRRTSPFLADIESVPRSTTQPVVAFEDGLRVVAPYVRPQTVDDSPQSWNSRAWTFQERLLSRRLLIFSGDEMVWHCRATIAREDMSIEESGYAHPPLQWLSLQPQHLGINVDSHWKDGNFEVSRHGQTFVVRSGTFAEYAAMIAQYSRRSMTFDGDVLNALAGLLHIFAIAFRSECIAGLPSILLDVALLWRPVKPLRRRIADRKFPSWSWAGWKGEIAYSDPVRMPRDQYSEQAIETEGIRPLLRYYVFSQNTGTLEPLNGTSRGTSRGLPFESDELPAEWEGSSSEWMQALPVPELFELDARAIEHLSSSHLVFYTSVVHHFDLFDPSHQSEKLLLQLPMMIDMLGRVMQIRFRDSMELGSTGSKLIVLAETSRVLWENNLQTSEFDRYLVMLVEEDPATGVLRRCGLGTVPKISWIAADPVIRLVCLG